MKKLLVAVMTSIIAVGAISAAMLVGFDDNFSITSVNPLKSGAMVMGHITLTATDENGLIKAYVQTDNVVTNIGDDCIAQTIFAGATGALCTNEGADIFDNIAIGVGDSTGATETSKALVSYYTGGPNIGASGAPTGFDTAVITLATVQGGASTLITTIFRNVGATITEAAIQNTENTVGTESVLAIQGFTGLPLGATDDLTVQWTVVIDGN